MSTGSNAVAAVIAQLMPEVDDEAMSLTDEDYIEYIRWKASIPDDSWMGTSSAASTGQLMPDSEYQAYFNACMEDHKKDGPLVYIDPPPAPWITVHHSPPKKEKKEVVPVVHRSPRTN